MTTERLLTLAVVVTVIVGISCQGVAQTQPKTPYCYPKCLKANERCITLARCPFAQPAKCNRCAVTSSIVCPAKESGGNSKQLLMLLGELLKNQYKQPTTPAPNNNNNNDLFGFGGSGGRGGKRSQGTANDFMTMYAMNSMFRR